MIKVKWKPMGVAEFIFWMLLCALLCLGFFHSAHTCPEPEPDHIPCEIAIDGLTEGMRLSRVAFGDVVDQFNQCNRELRLCRGYLPPIGGE